MSAFTVSVAMLSDWRIGSGTGAHGMIDRAVVRDEDGLPYVPAKSLTGIWRDGCEVAARALDDGANAGWHAWVEFLFGSQPSLASDPATAATRPRPAALSVDPARLPADLRAVLRDRPSLGAALTFLKPGIKVDHHTGAAERRMLRIDEVARGGITLVAAARIEDETNLTAAQLACAQALLWAGAALVESIGGGRRRGAGACRLMIDKSADHAAVLASTDVPSPPAAAAPDALVPARPVTESGRACTRLTLILRSPVIIAERTIGNSVRSADRVPGRVLLPAILRMLAAPQAHAAARAGLLLVTDATVAIDEQPGRPAPVTFLVGKTDRERLWNIGTPAAQPGPDARPLDGYISEDAPGGVVMAARPRMAEYTHNTIQDTVQRPTEDVGGLYTYEAMRPGTVLHAEVRVAPGVLPEGWVDRLRGEIRLGNSSKDDYGRVDFASAESIDPPPSPTVDDTELVVWAVSDLLVLDERLRPSTALADAARVLGNALGVVLTPVPGPAVAGQRRIESWHRGWGLPRASLMAFAAGTVLRFTISDGRLDPDRAAAVQTTGVGLRRAEGFGQIRLNPPVLAAAVHGVREVNGDPAPETAGGGDLGTASRSLLRIIERAAWRTEIRERSERLAADPSGRTAVLGRGHTEVPRTQLAGLRAAASPHAPDAQAWLESLATAGRKDIWPAAVRDRLRRLLTDPGDIWQLLDRGSEPALATLCVSNETVAELRDDLAVFARRTLIDDCLTAHRRSAESEEAR